MKKESKKKGRRTFMIQSALAGSALFIPGQVLGESFLNHAASTDKKLKIYLFSKHLQFLNYRDMSEAAKEMGFDGLDITIRPKGHVLPNKVKDDLPRATEAMQSFGLKPHMFSSNVIDAENSMQKQVLETASNLGYRLYRPAWVRYSQDDVVLEKVNQVKKQFEKLALLNKELNVTATYHNHSGLFFGGAVWDLHAALKDIPVEWFGAQYDIMHAAIEGGKNWEIGLSLIKPHINSLVVKDFIWAKSNGRWDRVNVPMGTGMIDFKKYFGLLKKYNINVPISIHVEHDLGGAEHGGKPTVEPKQVFKRIKNDLDFLKNTWAAV